MAEPEKEEPSDRVAVIGAVKTYLGFFVLVVLVVEAVLGALALNSEGENQLAAIYGMLAVIAALIVIVSFFAYRKPEALLRSAPAEMPSARDFRARITGHWWERITPDAPSAISLVEIRPDPATGAVKMKGTAYARSGELAANWESIASCLNPAERKVFFYWKGLHPARPNEPFEGFGEISFHESPGLIERGDGMFSDTNLTDMKSTTRKSIEVRRATADEVQTMQGDGAAAVAAMARRKLGLTG